MSMYLYENDYRVYAGQLNIKATDSVGNVTAPIVTDSSEVCANFNAEIWDGVFNANVQVGDILVCANAITNEFVRLPIGANAEVLTVNSGTADWLAASTGGVLLSDKTTLSSSNILNLNGTPITIIAAPGANKIIQIISVAFKLVYGTAAYTSGGNFDLQYATGPTNCAQNVVPASNGVRSAANVVRTWMPVSGDFGDVTNGLNSAVELTNDTGAFATGDSTAELTVTYVVHDLS